MPRAVRLLAPLVLAVLGGCFSLGRETTPLQQYVLGAVPVMADAAPLDAAALTVGVRRPDLAAYLATPQVVVRHAPNRIVLSEFHRWGEDLSDGIARALSTYLVSRGGIGRVDVAPWASGVGHDYRIQIRVLRFEGVVPEGTAAPVVEAPAEAAPLGEAHVRVSWEVTRPGDGAVVVRGVTDYREPGWPVDDHAALVALLDRGVYRLATDLADALARLPARP